MGFDQRPIRCLVALAGLFDQGGLGSALRPRHVRLIARIAGERFGYFAIKQALLLGLEYFAHIEHVLDRRFLQLAHTHMYIVDRQAHLRAVFLLLVHRLGEPRIRGAQR